MIQRVEYILNAEIKHLPAFIIKNWGVSDNFSPHESNYAILKKGGGSIPIYKLFYKF